MASFSIAPGPSPLFALVRRDVLRGMRSRRNFGLAALLVAISVYFAANAMPVEVEDSYLLLRAAGALFYPPLVLLFLTALVALPGQAALSISTERELETMDQLRLTSLRNGHILAGKLTSSLALFALFVLALLPVVAAVFFLIGIDARQFGMAYILLAASALFCSSLGLCASAFAHRSSTALFAALALGVATIGGSAGVVWILYESGVVGNAMPGVWAPAGVYLIPLLWIFSTANGQVLSNAAFAVALGVLLAWSAVFLFLALRFLARERRSPQLYESSGSGETAPPAPAPSANIAAVLEHLHRPQAEAGASTGVLAVLRKDTITSRIYWVLVVLAGLGTALVLSWTLTLEVEPIMVIMGLLLQVFVFQFIQVTITSGLFAQELELRGLELLRASLLSPGALFLGKTLASLYLLLPFFVVVHLVSGIVYVRAEPSDALAGAAFWTMTAQVLCLLVSAVLVSLASLLVRRRTAAIALSAAFVVVYMFGLPSFVTVLTPEGFTGREAPVAAMLAAPLFTCFATFSYLDDFFSNGANGPRFQVVLYGALLAHTCLLYVLVRLGMGLTGRVYWRRTERSDA